MRCLFLSPLKHHVANCDQAPFCMQSILAYIHVFVSNATQSMFWRVNQRGLQNCTESPSIRRTESARLAVDFVVKAYVAARGVTVGAARRACDCAVHDTKKQGCQKQGCRQHRHVINQPPVKRFPVPHPPESCPHSHSPAPRPPPHR
jgi:hypothetical protein